jgi:hypothetical protein
MLSTIALAFVLAAPPLSFADRVDGEQAVERARYAFVIGATKPFDEVYPRAVFEKKVNRELAEERVLASQFELHVTEALLAAEYDRIEKETRAPDQWQAVKGALGNSKPRIEEVFCRPALVDREIRARFAFDEKIHATEHQKARVAREAFLAGKKPAGTSRLRLSRRSEPASGTDEMLARARADAGGPKVLSPAGPEPKKDKPLIVDPGMLAVLEKEARSKGDVTTILEEKSLFSVFRLVSSEPDVWFVEVVRIPKRDFDRWLARSQAGGAAPICFTPGTASHGPTR